MKKFNIFKALDGKPVVTRNGLKVLELHLFNAGNAKYTLGAVIEKYNEIRAFTLKGQYLGESTHPLDLFMAEESYYGFKEGEDCYVIHTHGGIDQVIFNNNDSKHKTFKKFIAQGNVFKTIKEAEKERDYRAAKFRLNAKMRELEGDWEADWDDDTTRKYCFLYSCANNSIKLAMFETTKSLENWRYSNEETIEWVIENMADDIKIVLGVEQ